LQFLWQHDELWELAANLGNVRQRPVRSVGEWPQSDLDHHSVPPPDRFRGSLTGYGGGMERKQWLLASKGARYP